MVKESGVDRIALDSLFLNIRGTVWVTDHRFLQLEAKEI